MKLTAKERVLRILEELPEDSSYEEILRELAFGRMIDRGVEDSELNRTISHQELLQRIQG